jgi:3-hydroxyisobutyrate dehydrogenase-like beta-hydroxyacid dehydrogenase
MDETIGWIGVGSIGHRMVRHLAQAGYALLVADAASTERAPPGATIAPTNAAVAERADTIFLSLPDGKSSQTVAQEIAAASPRRVQTVIDTSTIGIAAAEAEAAILAAAGIAFVDAPVSGGTAGADKATLAIMLACPAATYERLVPPGPDGQTLSRGPRPGQGQAIKLPNSFLSVTAMAATSEAIAFGTGQGIAMKTILDIVNAATGRNTATSDKFANRILHGRYEAGFTDKLQLKDIRLFQENARAAGISHEVASAVVGVWETMDSDMPGADITRMYTYTQQGRQRKKLS